MNEHIEFGEEGRHGRGARVVMLETFVHALQHAHSPAVVLLTNAIREPNAIETQNAILVNTNEIGLLDQIA